MPLQMPLIKMETESQKQKQLQNYSQKILKQKIINQLQLYPLQQ